MVTPTSGGGGRSAPGRAKLDIHATADALDLPTTANRFDACPVCGGTKTAQLNDHHFHGFHADCRARGSAIDLIALHLDLASPDEDGRFPRLDAEQMPKVKAWLRDHPISTTTPGPKVEPASCGASTPPRSTSSGRLPVPWTATGR